MDHLDLERAILFFLFLVFCLKDYVGSLVMSRNILNELLKSYGLVIVDMFFHVNNYIINI